MRDNQGNKIPDHAWLGYKDGDFVTWYSSEGQAELALRYGRIDEYHRNSGLRHRS
jgi:hypothetical protein